METWICFDTASGLFAINLACVASVSMEVREEIGTVKFTMLDESPHNLASLVMVPLGTKLQTEVFADAIKRTCRRGQHLANT